MTNKRRVDIYIDRAVWAQFAKKGEGIFTLPGLRGHPPIDHGKGHSDKTIVPEGRKIGVDHSEENRSAQEEEMKGPLLFFPHNRMTHRY